MLTSGGEPLQLTNDEGDKLVNNFRLTAKKSITGGSRSQMKFGPCLHSEAVRAVWHLPTLRFRRRMALTFIMGESTTPEFFVREIRAERRISV